MPVCQSTLFYSHSNLNVRISIRHQRVLSFAIFPTSKDVRTVLSLLVGPDKSRWQGLLGSLAPYKAFVFSTSRGGSPERVPPELRPRSVAKPRLQQEARACAAGPRAGAGRGRGYDFQHGARWRRRRRRRPRRQGAERRPLGSRGLHRPRKAAGAREWRPRCPPESPSPGLQQADAP